MSHVVVVEPMLGQLTSSFLSVLSHVETRRALPLVREMMLQHCQRRISRLALTNCALLAWTFSDSVRGLAPKSIIDFAFGRSTPFLLASRSLGTRTVVDASPTTNNDHCSAPSQTMTATVAQVPCLSDNYGYLLHDPVSGSTAAIDTPDAQALLSELNRRGWTLTHIWNTHHHWDHTGGNAELKASHPNVQVVGPADEKAKIPGIDVSVRGGDSVSMGSIRAHVLDVGGHTRGHIAYHLPAERIVFVGDALFALGCGRMFEGTPEQFWSSLKRLRDLPDETTVYCAHEYTLSNGKFALSVEPANDALSRRFKEVEATRERGEPTVPSLLGLEKLTNPFLRVDVSDEIRRIVGATPDDSDEVVFGKVRQAKDRFRG